MVLVSTCKPICDESIFRDNKPYSTLYVLSYWYHEINRVFFI